MSLVSSSLMQKDLLMFILPDDISIRLCELSQRLCKTNKVGDEFGTSSHAKKAVNISYR